MVVAEGTEAEAKGDAWTAEGTSSELERLELRCQNAKPKLSFS